MLRSASVAGIMKKALMQIQSSLAYASVAFRMLSQPAKSDILHKDTLCHLQ